MLYMFFFIAILMCVFSYVNMDPMKSSFFLILSLLTVVPLISFFSYIWFSYFICMLFLSGIFVILVYFSSLSKFMYFKKSGSLIGGLITVIFYSPILMFFHSGFGITSFYYELYWLILLWVILILILFMNFVSYMLNSSGALRKV